MHVDLRTHSGLLQYQRTAWNHLVASGNRWTRPVGPEAIAEARAGRLAIVLTPCRMIPADWLPELPGARVLCLASGGGQQGPMLAAAGASVTVFDNSDQQLEQDRIVAQREGLSLETVQGDMADLSFFDDALFDAIVHPCSNCFAPDVNPVWRECARVLKPGGLLLAGIVNPMRFLFEDSRLENGSLKVCYRVPASDIADLDDEQRDSLFVSKREPLMFGHTLEDQIGGQLRAGFQLTGLYEDRNSEEDGDALSAYIASYIATRAVR